MDIDTPRVEQTARDWPASEALILTDLSVEVLLSFEPHQLSSEKAPPTQVPHSSTTATEAPENAIAGLKSLTSFLGRTALEMARAIPLALRVRNEFSPETQEGAPLPFKRLSLHGMLCKAEFGGIQADLARTGQVDRKLVQEISARTLAIVSVVDYFIDETDMRDSSKIALLESMKNSLRTGDVHSHQNLQLTKTSEACKKLYTAAADFPHGQLFIEEFCRLADAAISQIREPASLTTALQVGGLTGGVIASIPQAIKAEPELRLIKAARLFGAHVQLMDDVQDYAHDLEHGLHTPITSAIEPIRAAKDAFLISTQLYQKCTELLTVQERAIYEVLQKFGNLSWGVSNESDLFNISRRARNAETSPGRSSHDDSVLNETLSL